MEIEREYYIHDAGCPRIYHPANPRGLRTCKGCAGIFDLDGKGVCLTDTRFDENWEARRAAGAGWNDGGP